MGYPQWLEPRWNHFRLNHLHIFWGCHAGGGRPVPTSDVCAVFSSIRKMRQRRRRWLGTASRRFFDGADRTTGTSRRADGRARAPDHGGQRGRSAGRSAGARAEPCRQIKEDMSERQTIADVPVPQIAGEIVAPVPLLREEIGEVLQLPPLQHAHFGRVPFEKDGRKYFDCEESKDLIQYQPLTPQTIDQPGDQARRDPADPIHRQGCPYACASPWKSRRRSPSAEFWMRLCSCRWAKRIEIPQRDFRAVVSVNNLMHATMELLCRRATLAFRRRPAKNRGLLRSL